MQKSKSNHTFKVDLSLTEEGGEFECPKCGSKISPDDHTEDVYTLLETVMKGNNLDKIILKCNRCESTINVTGFNVNNK
jgi:DNA-directed RNA polymerase subunit RPC12/RpoP